MNDLLSEDRLSSIRLRLDPFLNWNLAAWQGLPELPVQALNRLFAAPASEETAELGWYPAQRLEYPVDNVPSGGLVAYARDNRVRLIEAIVPPPSSVIDTLEEPSAILPNEISVQGAYVPEYLYCQRGLVLSVARPFDETQPLRVLRCRGIHPIERPDQFDTELYRSEQTKTFW
ncbi:MAG: hypothetical protein WCF57_01700 [Pyrinomonadaceae bacterium]